MDSDSFLFSFYFLNFSSPWEQVAVISLLSPIPLVISRPVSEVSLLNTMVLNLFLGKCLEQNTMGKESPLICSTFIFIFSRLELCIQHHHHRALWEKRKALQPLWLGWRVLGPCVVVHRILAFFLSLYIGLRDYTVSM